VIKIRRMTG